MSTTPGPQNQNDNDKLDDKLDVILRTVERIEAHIRQEVDLKKKKDMIRMTYGSGY